MAMPDGGQDGAVTAQMRHTRTHRCEVCDGADGDARGKGKRCHGFTSEDGKWCFCSQVESNHQTSSGLWRHLLRDEPFGSSEITFTTSPGLAVEVERYAYRDETGAVLFYQIRKEPKAFCLQSVTGAASIQGVRRVLYRLPELLASEGLVFIVEGEKDVDALRALGLVATCNPFGAGKWASVAEHAAEVLAGRDVVIIQDKDGPETSPPYAGQAHAKTVADALSSVAKSIRIVEVPEGKDASDYIQAGATASAFLKLWTDADQPRAAIEWVGLADMAKPLPPVEWACEGLKLARGPVSCFAGYGYSGKTAIAQALLLCLATGKSLFGLFKCPQMPVGWMDYEQGWRMSAGRMQRQARGMGIDLGAYPSNALRYAEFPDVYLDEKGSGVDKVAKAVDGMGLCLMDSAKAITPGIDENDSRIRIPFDALSRVTMKTGCIFLVIHHFGKSGGDQTKLKPLKERMRGSSALFDAMQTVWGLEAKEKETHTRVELAKDRVTNLKNLEFGVQFVDDAEHDAVTLRHLDPEQMKSPTKASLFKAHALETIKINHALTSVEAIRFHMPEGYRNLNEVRSAVRELGEANQIATVNGAYRAL